MKLKNYFNLKKDIRTYAALVSVFFTVIVLLHRQPTNPDAGIYIDAAIAYGHQGIKAAMHIYPWPFFSVVLYYTAKITHLSYLSAGLLVNNIFIAGLVVIFISLIKALGGNYRLQCIAAIIILLNPYLNHFRDNVLRDVGYYTFGLLAILLLVQFCQSQRWRHALIWSASMMLATLFRIEGAVFILLAPLVILTQAHLRRCTRIALMIRAYLLPLILVAAGCLGLVITGKLSLLSGSRLTEILFELRHGFVNTLAHLATTAEQVKLHIIGVFGKPDAMSFVLGGILGILFNNLLGCLGIVYFVLSLHGILGNHFKTNAKRVIYWFAIINFLVCFLFISQQLFISQRHVFFFALAMMAPAVYSVEKIYSDWRQANGRWWVLTLLCLGLFYNLIAGLGHFGVSKTYIVDAGQWISNTTPTSSKVFVNDIQIYLYANRSGDINRDSVEFLRNFDTLLMQYDYIALKVSHDNTGLYRQVTKKTKPVKTFSNHHGDKVIIIKGTP